MPETTIPMGDDPPLLAPDTNLLAYETSRRMLYGIAVETGYAIAVLPEVFIETQRRVTETVEQSYLQRLAQDPRYHDATKQRIAAAAGSAAKDWFEEQLASPGSIYVRLTESLHQTWRSRLIALKIPPGVVRSNLRSITGDPLILAQAVAFDVTLLSTNNLRTIHHANANEWAKKMTHRDRQLIYTSDETLDELSQGSDDTLYAWTIAYGMRPPNRDEGICRNEYEAALNRVYGASFRNTSETARWRYENDPRFMASVHTARQREGVAAAALSEAQRQDKVLKAATQEGWAPEP